MQQPVGLKRNEILIAAQHLFAEKGYQGTTLEDVITQTGGSRRNVYALFGDKEGLFKAAMVDKVTRVFESVFESQWAEGTPETVIRNLGQTMMIVLTSAETVSLFQVIAAEARRFPELGEYLYQHGPSRAYGELERYLETQVENGRLEVEDCRQLAEQLVQILRGDLYLLNTLCVNRPIPEVQIERQINAAVAYLATFCR